MAKIVRKKRMKRKFGNRQKIAAKYQISKDAVIDYKDLSLLQKFINDRGKILPRRITGISAKSQRDLGYAVKRARFLALLPSGGVR